MLFGFENVNLCCSGDAQLSSFNRESHPFFRRFIPLLAREMEDSFQKYQFDLATPHYNTATPPTAIPKIVFFFRQEKPETPGWLKKHYRAIFRQHLDDQHQGNIFPMPLSIDHDPPAEVQRDMSQREINIFFSGNMNAHRVDLYRALLKKSKTINSFFWKRLLASRYRKKMPQNIHPKEPRTLILFTDGFSKGLSRSEYFDTLGNSICVLCPQGYTSADTMRHYEAMKFGCIAISTAIPRNDLYRDSPHISVKRWEEVPQLVKRLCSDPQRLEQMHRAARAWWHETGSEAAFAKYVAEKISDRKLPDNITTGL